LLWLALVFGCAPSLPPAYQRQRAAAERAYAAGRYEEAAQHWRKAETAADRRRDRADALYRQAASLRRAGQLDKAKQRLHTLVSQYPKSHRTDRARYDLADISIEQGERDAGFDALRKFFSAHPDSPLAVRALTRYVDFVSERRGEDQALSWLASARSSLARTELGEARLYLEARHLEQRERRTEARDRYLELADDYPYPKGAYWDDALERTAELELQLGAPERAVSHLQRLLGERESSHLQGSYQKPSYAEARFRIAELFRDELNDPRRALSEFRRVFSDHPTSLRRDDALWEEAKLARKLGDADRVCGALTLLKKELPDSRYTPCASRLCPRVAAVPGRSCRNYLIRELGGS
jgi:TolA-binding protein